jgi:3-oxoacyl-[acyl-carrier protein] reductase
MDTGLKGKKVLVLGSSRGIGLGIAKAFISEGADVMVSARNAGDLEQAVAQLKSLNGGAVHSYEGDLLKPEVVEELGKVLNSKLGSLDHLVCNLGSGRSVNAGEEDVAEAKRVMDINFFQAVGAIRTFRPLLKRNGQKDWASITLIGSICGRQVLGCPSTYAAAKAALLHYAKNLAKPLALEGIRINVVSPGNILFPGSVWEQKLKDSESQVKAMLDKDVPLKKFGTPQDIGAAVVYLASSNAGFITGTELVVDGGQSN